MASPMEEDRYGIAFFDLETTIPTRIGQGRVILEFGSILVCPRKLVELESYSTLVRPSDLSLVAEKSTRCNGITRGAVASAPPFVDIADKVYDLLHGRIWAGHNILRFDCPRIREAFVQIGRPAPEPKGCIDTLEVLTQKFGRRAGNMKMASLASYFGLGQQIHRSLQDVRMNLEVVKYCATVLFLESSLPGMITTENQISPNTSTRSPPYRQLQRVEMTMMTPSSDPVEHSLEGRILDLVQCSTSTIEPEPSNMNALENEIREESLQRDNAEERTPAESSAPHSVSTNSPFLIPDQVSVQSITASPVRGYQRYQILHKEIELKLACSHLKVLFGVSSKYSDQAGRPKLSIVVDAPPSLFQVLDACDSHAQSFFMQSGSTSDWRPLVTRNSYWNNPTIRLHIPTIVTGEVAEYGTEICHKETGVEQRIQFNRFDLSELDALFSPGVVIDTHISLNPYDYLQNAGIKLVAEKTISAESKSINFYLHLLYHRNEQQIIDFSQIIVHSSA
ncbi:hypothetical protein V2J09_016981 [Rumex salicifolius]